MREKRAPGPLRRLAACLLLAPMVHVGCASDIPTVQEENAIGQQVKAQIRSSNRLLRDPVVVTYIRKLGRELAESAERSPYRLSFYVVSDPEFNAFAIPGGSIYINTGTILKVSDEAQLAGIVAHEIGHVTARHVAKAVGRQENSTLFARYLSLITYILSGGRVDPTLVTVFGLQGYLGTYSRDAEREADKLGLETLARSKYDPEGLIRAMQTIQAEVASSGGGGTPAFLRTHPVAEERIENLKAQFAALGGDYREEPVDEERFLRIQRRVRLLQGLENYGGDEDSED